MSSNYLTLNIQYEVKNDRFNVGGNVNLEGQSELVGTFLEGQFGAGVDEREAIIRDVYDIELKWYTRNDIIEVRDNTGRKGLRDGILMRFLEGLSSD